MHRHGTEGAGAAATSAHGLTSPLRTPPLPLLWAPLATEPLQQKTASQSQSALRVRGLLHNTTHHVPLTMRVHMLHSHCRLTRHCPSRAPPPPPLPYESHGLTSLSALLAPPRRAARNPNISIAIVTSPTACRHPLPHLRACTRSHTHLVVEVEDLVRLLLHVHRQLRAHLRHVPTARRVYCWVASCAKHQGAGAQCLPPACSGLQGVPQTCGARPHTACDGTGERSMLPLGAAHLLILDRRRRLT